MRHLERMLRGGPRTILLLGAAVLLPAVALGLLALRTLQGEQVRETYQRKERQQQILRLLERELSDWVMTLRADASTGRFALEVQHDIVRIPGLNVRLSPGSEHETPARLAGRELIRWRDAQSAEFQSSNRAGAAGRYRLVLAEGPVAAAWARLALLRLALQRGDASDAAVWLERMHDADRAATTESGIPVHVGAALLLVDAGGAAWPSHSTTFLDDTLTELMSGAWALTAAQWAYYARTISEAPGTDPCLGASAQAIADSLDALAGAVNDVLALNQSLEWSRDRPFVSRYLPDTRGVVFLFRGEGRTTGIAPQGAEILKEANARLAALTAAEAFEGHVAFRGDHTRSPGAPIGALDYLEASFPRRDQGLLRPYFRRYIVYYAAGLLLLGAATGLFFTYRAVAHEIELSRMKAGFIASVSHEFRTPLSAIEAMLERLESGKVRDEDMLHRYYHASRREVRRLSGMVSQLLDFSRLEEGREQYRFETIDLNDLARNGIETFADLGFGARLSSELVPTEALNITADRDAVRQCIHNLIDNALKYSPHHSPVTITSGRRDGNVYLGVADRGPGIAQAEQSLIFERFYRIGNAGAEGVQGTGIGLALVQSVMTAHGGRVALDSRPGAGSTFELVFPEAKA